jgi:hypothetical protein
MPRQSRANRSCVISACKIGRVQSCGFEQSHRRERCKSRDQRVALRQSGVKTGALCLRFNKNRRRTTGSVRPYASLRAELTKCDTLAGKRPRRVAVGEKPFNHFIWAPRADRGRVQDARAHIFAIFCRFCAGGERTRVCYATNGCIYVSYFRKRVCSASFA